MSQTLKQVQELAAQQNILISDHGYDELASDDIFVQDVIEGVADEEEIMTRLPTRNLFMKATTLLKSTLSWLKATTPGLLTFRLKTRGNSTTSDRHSVVKI